MQLSKAQQRKQLEEKWTPTLIAPGWTAIPSVLLERQQALGLDAVDINIILHLARHWWHSGEPPYPSKRTIAQCMGIDESTVRRRIAAMEKDGLIRREPRYSAQYGQRTNFYHFEGLIRELLPYAQEAIALREQRQKENAARRIRKRPQLKVVKDVPSQD